MQRIRNERGVAMVTVLLIAAVLTVTSSTAAFITIREFGATNDDLRATRALAFAEAGIDRSLLAIRATTNFNWNDLVLAGCTVAGITYPKQTLVATIGEGSYEVEIERENAPASCPASVPSPRDAQKVWITSTGRHPEATRRVRQHIEVQWRNLPIGLYAEQGADGGGSGDVTDVSLITGGEIQRRDQISFVGFDKFYKIGDFYPDSDDPRNRWLPGFYTSADLALPMPAAAHAAGGSIIATNGTVEHTSTTTSPNCRFNGNKGTNGQSLWDGSKSAPTSPTVSSGCTSPPENANNAWTLPFPNGAIISKRYPPTLNFQEADLARLAPTPRLTKEEYEFLKSTAKSSGLYCTATTATDFTSCEGPGTAPTGKTISDANLPATGNVVVYVDFPPGTTTEADSPQRTVTWQGKNLPLCSTSDPASNRSVIIVIRNGSLSLANGSQLSGALLVPEGTVSAAGGHTTEGTIIARVINISGTGTFKLSQCWIDNMSTLFLRVTGLKWRELDR